MGAREIFTVPHIPLNSKVLSSNPTNPTTLSVAITEAQMDSLKETLENDNQTLEVTSKAATIDNEAKKSSKKLIENLSAALVNVSVKEDLVKQHAKVAEEAVVGVVEESVDPDGDTDEQVPNEQDVGATEQNADQYGDANEQVSDEQDLGAAEQNTNQHEDIN
ncbi:hypothetical protein CQW23_25846 [Capsicum baccatum]|uniref:Uncharacterized protein n=1 Tax=Capsicum baccatum TaxID=33114 RepID=A0A2G2VM46_CAPBA|nr:hypothetical protein CQW23_25846 [Capsicum baccatum]